MPTPDTVRINPFSQAPNGSGKGGPVTPLNPPSASTPGLVPAFVGGVGKHRLIPVMYDPERKSVYPIVKKD